MKEFVFPGARHTARLKTKTFANKLNFCPRQRGTTTTSGGVVLFRCDTNDNRLLSSLWLAPTTTDWIRIVWVWLFVCLLCLFVGLLRSLFVCVQVIKALEASRQVLKISCFGFQSFIMWVFWAKFWFKLSKE